MDLDGESNSIHDRRHFTLRARGERDHGTQPRSAGQPAGSSALNVSADSLSLGDLDEPQAGAALGQRLAETVAGKRTGGASNRPPGAGPYFRFGSVSRILSAIRILLGRLRCIAIPSQ